MLFGHDSFFTNHIKTIQLLRTGDDGMLSTVIHKEETLFIAQELPSSSARKTLDSQILAKKTADEQVDILVTLQEALTALGKAQEEQARVLAATKTEEKNIEKKAETKKDKDITVVVDSDDSKENLKDKFKEGILSITLDMDGFEKFHLQQYQQQLANYSRFLAEYLDGTGVRPGKFGQSYTYSDTKEEEKPRTMEVQMLTYGESQDFVRTTIQNELLGKAGSNYIDPNTKETWELWKVFQHNFIWSTYYTSQWRN